MQAKHIPRHQTKSFKKTTSSKTNNRKGAATFYATPNLLFRPAPWNDQGQQSRRSPKSRHLRRFFWSPGVGGWVSFGSTKPPTMPVTTR